MCACVHARKHEFDCTQLQAIKCIRFRMVHCRRKQNEARISYQNGKVSTINSVACGSGGSDDGG